METNTKIGAGILGLLLVLAGFGGSILLTPEQLDHAYVCSISEKVGIFDRLSSTAKSGYFIDETGAEKSAVCTGGLWIPLKEYAAAKGVSVDQFLKSSQLDLAEPGQPGGLQYRCDQTKCEVLN